MRNGIRRIAAAAAAALGSALLAAAPALAQVAAEHPGATGGGMPQLNFGHPLLIAQVVWLLVIFGLLYAVMAQVALPGVASVLAERRRRIDGDLQAAQAAKARADEALAQHRAATAKARSEGQAAIAEAVGRAQAEAAARSEELNARLNSQIEQAERRIAAARDSAMGALRQVSADTAEALVSRLIGGGSPDRGAVERAVDGELAARGRA
jgi:F-type H+-transporting ATPase subunit b